uniref:Zona pellucida sperm-binding protein 4 n=1 Tax=Erpetoichthys calabaricus TaxID=27687 RepID=A0A8C4SUR4_ERPCA
MARLEFWCICWLVLCVSVVRFVSGDVFVIKKCDGFKTMTLSFHGSPTVYLQSECSVFSTTGTCPRLRLRVWFAHILYISVFLRDERRAGKGDQRSSRNRCPCKVWPHHTKGALFFPLWLHVSAGEQRRKREPVLLDAVSSVTERCTMANHEKLPCGGSSSITQADCEANNCCYDLSSSTSPCYYADDVTVQCTLDGQFVVVVSENVTLPPLDLGSIQLVDSSCSPVTSLSSFVVYQFPVSACGSTVQVSGGNVTYQNTMSAAITVRSGPEGSITRDSVYKLFFQCTYLGSQDVQVEAEVYTVAPPLPVVEQGPFDLELVIATDSSYGSYYVDADYPVTKTLRDPVAVEVHIMNRTDPNLVLTLGDCWVTPGPSTSSQPQWSLLVNGCPYTGDNYLTSLVTVDSTSGLVYPSHYKRFVFEMFAFVDPVAQKALAEKIFIYCVAAACYPSATDPCTQTCPSRSDVSNSVPCI